jgi:hypothetical protein
MDFLISRFEGLIRLNNDADRQIDQGQRYCLHDVRQCIMVEIYWMNTNSRELQKRRDEGQHWPKYSGEQRRPPVESYSANEAGQHQENRRKVDRKGDPKFLRHQNADPQLAPELERFNDPDLAASLPSAGTARTSNVE